MAYTVINTTSTDLPVIYGFFDQSIAYQEQKGYISWKNYDKAALQRDVAAGNQYKVLVDSEIGIVFSVCYTDQLIWRDMERGDAIYLHRIVVNPTLKGKKLFGVILDWVVEHARQRGLRFIRMDTWANNPNIISYYRGFGFLFKEFYTTPDTEELPVHNRKLALALLEFELK